MGKMGEYSDESLRPDHPWLENPKIIDRDFELMEKSGCNTFSVGIFSWTALEPAPGEYRFDWLDRIMDRMAEHGFHVILATPSGAKPAWLATAPRTVRFAAQPLLEFPRLP